MATRRKATNETVITPKPLRVGSPNKASVGRIFLAFLLIGATSFGGIVVACQASSVNIGGPMISPSTGALDLSEPAGPRRVEYGDPRGKPLAFETARLE
jgi:hypothetical protein